VYARRPFECQTWSCGWLREDDTADQLRPDRSHYIIDTASQSVVDVETSEGKKVRVAVIPIWVDPKFPDAYKDPRLRAYLERLASQSKLGLINREFLLLPPAISGTGEWREQPMTSSGAPPALVAA